MDDNVPGLCAIEIASSTSTVFACVKCKGANALTRGGDRVRGVLAAVHVRDIGSSQFDFCSHIFATVV